MRELFAPSLGRHVKLGRRRPVAKSPRLRLSRYLRLPTPPPSCNYSPKGAGALAQMYGNDALGDCVIAGGYHVVGVETGNAGAMYVAPEAAIVRDYSAIGGYVPGDPSTDNGCDEQTALDYWTQHGFANGTKLCGAVSIDPTNKFEVMAAMYLFENLFFGLELPDAWISPFPSAPGFVWAEAGASDPQNGHCVIGTGYTPQGVTIDTWGMLGTLTWGAIASYCPSSVGGNLYVMLTPDQLAKGQVKAPSGLDWRSLVVDFDAIGGHVPVPLPPPIPGPPAPVPVPPHPVPAGQVTLAQAQGWVTQALAAHWPK